MLARHPWLRWSVPLVGVVISRPALAAEMYLKAVKRNGLPITPTSLVDAMPGDVITTEVFVCGWESDVPGSTLAFYMATLDFPNQAATGDSGTILPNGWDAPPFLITCMTELDCLDLQYPICTEWISNDYCTGPNFNPSSPPPNPPYDDGSFVDTLRADYVYDGTLSYPGVAVRRADINFGAFTIYPEFEGPTDPGCGDPMYCATMTFKLSDDASGTFELDLITDNERTVLHLAEAPDDPVFDTVVPNTRPLAVNVGLPSLPPIRPFETTCFHGASDQQYSCAVQSDCGDGHRCATRSRVLSMQVEPGDVPGVSTSVRVGVVDSPNQDQIGDTWWVGPDLVIVEPPASLVFAALECTETPFEQVWDDLPGFHIYGEAIIPGATFEVRRCHAGECSAPTMFATGVYGDVAAPFGAGQPNFGDISAQVAKFQGTAGQISLSRALLRPSLLHPTTGTSFLQISATVAAFQGLPYSEPPSTPGANRCP